MKVKNKFSSQQVHILLSVLITGFIIVLILLYSSFQGIQLTAKYAPLVNAAMEIKLKATNAHLWFEEILSGDQDKEMEAVWKYIDQADWYAMAMLKGGENQEGTYLPLEDEEMRRIIISVRSKLFELRNVTKKRLKEKETSTVGTDIDKQYDVIFKNFIEQADTVETMLQSFIMKDFQQFKIIHISLIMTSIFLTIFVGFVLNRYEQRKQKNINILEDINKLLLDEIKAHNQVEEKLYNINNSLNISIENMPSAYILLNQNLHVVEWNKAAEDIFGYSKEEMLGKNPVNYIVPKPVRHLVNDVLKKLKKGEVADYSEQDNNIRKDGKLISCQWFNTPLADKNGDIFGILTLVQDITERKQAEEALHNIAVSFSAVSGKEFFNKVSDYLADKLNIDYAFIGELVEEDRVRTVGGVGKGDVLDPFEYELKNTPCENVMGQSLCCYTSGIQELFPKDLLLVEMGIDGYLGIPLFDSSGKALGIMVLLSEKPITNQKIAESTLQIFSDRVSAEIERKQVEERLRQRLHFDQIISSISSRFIGVIDLDEAINASFADMSKLSGASRVYLFLFSEDGKNLNNTHEWCAKGVSPEKDNLQNLPCNMFPWWMDKLRNGETIHVKDVSSMPKEAKVEKELLEVQDIKSLIVLPVNIGKKLSGFIGFDNVLKTGDWSKEDITLLQIFSKIIGNALERMQAEKALKESEEHFRNIFENSTAGIYRSTFDGHILLANPSLLKMLGFQSFDDLSIRNLEKEGFLPENSRSKFLLELNKKGVVRDYISTWIKKDGSHLIILENAKKYYDEKSKQYIIDGVVEDITERKQAEEHLKRRLHFDQIISSISSRFIGVIDVDEAINASFTDMSKLSGASRVYLFLFCKDGKNLNNTHEWCAKGVSPEKDNLQNIPCNMFPWWMDKLHKGETIHIKDVSNLPKEAKVEKELLEAQDIKSLIVLPLYIGKKLSGFIGFDNVIKTGDWSKEDITLLQISSEIIGNALERKQAEEAMQESEERYRSLTDDVLDSSGVGIIILDADFRVVWINQALQRFFGLKRKKIIGKDKRQLVRGRIKDIFENPETFIGKVLATYENNTYIENFECHVLPDGEREERWLEHWSQPIRSGLYARGRIEHYYDITDNKRTKEALLLREQQLSLIYDSTGDILYYLEVEPGPNYRFLTVNSAFLKATDLTVEQIVGKTINEVTPKPSLKLVRSNYKKAIREKRILYWEETFQYPAGLKTGIVSIAPVFDDKGNCTHLVGSMHDITERKTMEKRLRESQNRLRSLAERLQMIREEERATIAREIHDDLGQSLTALKMDISWIKNKPEMDAETYAAKFDIMLDLTNSTIQTVKRIATELRPGILDDLGLVPAIKWQAGEFQNRFKLQCNVSINKSDVIIKDEISIAVFRIFQETLTNVARHSGANKVDISLNFYDDNKLIMEIADNGVGIDEEQINSPKSFGLFGMKERVNILNGEMEIIGEHGKGTKVRISIPVSKEEMRNK